MSKPGPDPMTRVNAYMTNETLTEFMLFSEVGVFAADPDEGEILYAYASAGERGDFLPAYDGSPYIFEENFLIDIYTANVTILKINRVEIRYASEIRFINRRSGLQATNVQDAIDELSGNAHRIDSLFEHGLNTYPDVLLIEMDPSMVNGFGIAPYGTSPYGRGLDEAGESIKIPCGVVYPDTNSLWISTGRNYGRISQVYKLTDSEYLIDFVSGTTLMAILMTNWRQ